MKRYLLPVVLGGMLANPLFAAAQDMGAKTAKSSYIEHIIYISLGFFGVFFVIVILLGGFQLALAGGNSDAEGKGGSTLISGIVGLLLIASIWVIVHYILQSISGSNI